MRIPISVTTTAIIRADLAVPQM